MIEFVRELEVKLEAFMTNVPAQTWAQLGSPTLTCESMAVGTSGVRQEPVVTGSDRCGMFDILEVIAGIARECKVEFEEDGTTSPEQAEEIAAILDPDTEALIAWADSLNRPATALTNIQWQIEGGLVATILTTSVYIGW